MRTVQEKFIEQCEQVEDDLMMQVVIATLGDLPTEEQAREFSKHYDDEHNSLNYRVFYKETELGKVTKSFENKLEGGINLVINFTPLKDYAPKTEMQETN